MAHSLQGMHGARIASIVATVVVLAGCSSTAPVARTEALDPAAAADALVRARTGTSAASENQSVDDGVLDPTDIAGDPINQYDLQLGDCFNRYEDLRAGRKYSATSRLSCDEPHQYEVFHTTQFLAPHPAIYPGTDVVEEFALQACYLEFEAFVGTIYELSEFDIGVFTPTRENFEDDAARYRGIHCWLYSESEDQIVGSARGTRR